MIKQFSCLACMVLLLMEGWDWQDRKALEHLNFDAMIETRIEQPDASNNWSQKTIARLADSNCCLLTDCMTVPACPA